MEEFWNSAGHNTASPRVFDPSSPTPRIPSWTFCLYGRGYKERVASEKVLFQNSVFQTKLSVRATSINKQIHNQSKVSTNLLMQLFLFLSTPQATL